MTVAMVAGEDAVPRYVHFNCAYANRLANDPASTHAARSGEGEDAGTRDRSDNARLPPDYFAAACVHFRHCLTERIQDITNAVLIRTQHRRTRRRRLRRPRFHLYFAPVPAARVRSINGVALGVGVLVPA